MYSNLPDFTRICRFNLIGSTLSTAAYPENTLYEVNNRNSTMHIFEVGHCLMVCNAPLKLASSISGYVLKNASRVVANHVQFENKYPVTQLFPKISQNLPTVCWNIKQDSLN